MEKQVVSKQRVVEHGEVLTREREVNAMLDLVKSETERIDSRFLEPACGTGNFLAEILERKLSVVARRYRKSQLEYERYAVLAISSIYGIDILEDNVEECRRRLFVIFNREYTGIYKKRVKEQCRQSIKTILDRNILWGDARSLMTVGNKPRPIIFSEWSFPFHDSKIQRRDFMFSELIPPEQNGRDTQDLFSQHDLVSDSGNKVFIPKEMNSEKPVCFLKLGEEHDNKTQPRCAFMHCESEQ